MIIIFTTLPSFMSAESLASKILDAKLAACCSILRTERSMYRWKGKVRKESELLLMIKTRKASYSKLEAFIKKNHPHSCPEIIGIPASKVSKEYKKWAYAETSKP
ncbi:divalent-cation tolerance protein CutA [Candidatus Micrarchaeota archaeon]|nr:divalent-cation tolerance protein CutA [Candidatus Micrarchaeota archaeon]